MSKPTIFYEFAGLRLFPESQQLEILSSHSKMNLSPTHCRFLIALARKPRQTVSYDELRRAVWTHLKELDETLKKNIHSTKNGLINILKQAKINTDFIEVIHRQGYRLNADVSTPDNEEENLYFHTVETFSDKSQVKEKVFEPKRDLAFIFIVSFFYGLLFWSALLLESAYKFQDLKSKVVWFALPLILWNSAIMLAALNLTSKALRKNSGYALFTGISILILGALLSSLIVFFLPNETVTLARFQTQPAISAYIKNVWMYFLPLGIFFILLPFYAVCGKKHEKKVFTTPPRLLFGLWLTVLIYSIFSTFYLLDNLLPSENHALFTVSVVFRFVNYFGLGIAVLLWYFSNTQEKSKADF